MPMRHLVLAAAIACLALAGTPALAGGSVKDRGPAIAGAGAPPPAGFVAEGQGCYWDWGELRCFSYCYYEIDGRRYCTRRQRDAYPKSYNYYYGRWARPDVRVQPDYRRNPPIMDYRNAPVY